MATHSNVSQLSLDVPAKWVRQDLVAFLPPPVEGEPQPNITVVSRPANGMDLPAAIKEVRNAIVQQRLPKFRFDRERATTVGAVPAFRFDIIHSTPADAAAGGQAPELRRAHIVAVAGERVYEVSLSSGASARPETWQGLEDVIGSMTLGSKTSR